jgi:gamma-glutamyltranspeptidase/glutathione hydrolase
MVSSAHPLASMAGVRILQSGGNATDAAVAVAAALNVVEPHMSGLAGVGWMLFHHAATNEAEVLNYSGCAPSKSSPDLVSRQQTWTGPLAPVVPGGLAGWCAALERHGSMSLEEVFQDAIHWAEFGHPLSRHQCAVIDFCWKGKLAGFEDFANVFLPGGSAPVPGQNLRQDELAATLKWIGAEGPGVLYGGDLGRKVADYCKRQDGLVSLEDLARYEPSWETPLVGDYRGYELRTLRPNASAFQLLLTMNILECFPVSDLDPNGPELIHLLAEAGKLAVADRICWCADPRFAEVPLDALLDKEYAAKRANLIDPSSAMNSEGNRFNPDRTNDMVAPDGFTTHFSIVDSGGNIVSCTQTNGMMFGSGMVVPGTGIVLNNGMHWFELDERSVNVLRGGKRFEMPLMPIQVFHDARPVLCMGTPGNYGIPHTTAHQLVNILDFGADVQESIEAPRSKPETGRRLEIESRIPESVQRALEERGHELHRFSDWSMELGGVQGIQWDVRTGALQGGADPRRDGVAIGY